MLIYDIILPKFVSGYSGYFWLIDSSFMFPIIFIFLVLWCVYCWLGSIILFPNVNNVWFSVSMNPTSIWNEFLLMWISMRNLITIGEGTLKGFLSFMRYLASLSHQVAIIYYSNNHTKAEPSTQTWAKEKNPFFWVWSGLWVFIEVVSSSSDSRWTC